jgi:hypothetical protein
MKLRSSHSATLALALLPLACLTSACHRKPHVVEQSGWSALQSGDYMRDEYMQAVTVTRSPYKAWQEMEASKIDESIQTISITNDKDGISLAFGYNFHEGTGPIQPETDVTVKPDIYAPPYSLDVLNRNEFVLSNNTISMRFRYVGDWQKWVDEATIAGTYQDAKGQLYIFQPDGQAEFPGEKTFDYSVGADMILTDYDYIYSDKLKNSWAFTTDSSGIKLFDVDENKNEPDGLVSSKPRWVLKKLASQQP